MTNKEIQEIAMKQSAEDVSCKAADFLSEKNVVKPFRLGKNARIYFREPISCDFNSYGNNVVASTIDEISDIVSEYVTKFNFYRCFKTPYMHWLNERLVKRGHKICFMAEYFLPDVSAIPNSDCGLELKILRQDDFKDLYIPQWSNALGIKERDIMGVGAYSNGRLVGLAACSNDCDTMWQIGVDVLPEFRQKGIASAITSRLALEILNAGKVPFYCCTWSNIRSARNAIKSGFRPAWVEMTVKPTDIVDKMNGQ